MDILLGSLICATERKPIAMCKMAINNGSFFSRLAVHRIHFRTSALLTQAQAPSCCLLPKLYYHYYYRNTAQASAHQAQPTRTELFTFHALFFYVVSINVIIWLTLSITVIYRIYRSLTFWWWYGEWTLNVNHSRAWRLLRLEEPSRWTHLQQKDIVMNCWWWVGWVLFIDILDFTHKIQWNWRRSAGKLCFCWPRNVEWLRFMPITEKLPKCLKYTKWI